MDTIVKNTKFAEELANSILPRVVKMKEREMQHLDFLIENNASSDNIEISQWYINYLTKRIGEYEQYIKNNI